MSARMASGAIGQAARVALALVVALAAWIVVPRPALYAQDELVEEGNRLYQQSDFAGAAAAYEAVLGAGFESAALHYNLGNAYFKVGDLGRSILAWERALALSPGDADALANLELARSLTADAVQPLPRFWLFEVVAWWVQLVPRALLIGIVGFAWLVGAGGVITRLLARGPDAVRWGTRAALAGTVVVLVLGTNLIVRELGIGRAERGVVLADVVPVRSAPSEDDDLTLFEIHEGTRVRIDQRTGDWAEIVLDDGKVGWVRADVFERI